MHLNQISPRKRILNDDTVEDNKRRLEEKVQYQGPVNIKDFIPESELSKIPRLLPLEFKPVQIYNINGDNDFSKLVNLAAYVYMHITAENDMKIYEKSDQISTWFSIYGTILASITNLVDTDLLKEACEEAGYQPIIIEYANSLIFCNEYPGKCIIFNDVMPPWEKYFGKFPSINDAVLFLGFVLQIAFKPMICAWEELNTLRRVLDQPSLDEITSPLITAEVAKFAYDTICSHFLFRRWIFLIIMANANENNGLFSRVFSYILSVAKFYRLKYIADIDRILIRQCPDALLHPLLGNAETILSDMYDYIESMGVMFPYCKILKRIKIDSPISLRRLEPLSVLAIAIEAHFKPSIVNHPALSSSKYTDLISHANEFMSNHYKKT